MSDDQLFFVPDRKIDYAVFDSDNHMYERSEAFTKFLPPQYEGIVKYVQESDNRTKLVVKDRITRAIPNPTFVRVAPPGGQQDDPLHRRSIGSLDAFFDVEPRYKLMTEFGIDRALMWPTLASVIEQALPDDPLAVLAIVHALNQWMHEHWTFGYEDTIYPTPAVALTTVDGAIKELEWVVERGARIVYIRPAPVFGFGGPRSFALPEFDPFWEAMQEKDVVVGVHNTVNQRYPVDLLELDGTPEAAGDFRQYGMGGRSVNPAFRALCTPRSFSSDIIASMVGHGMLTRFPKLKVAIVEHFTDWVRPMYQQFEAAWEKSPVLFDENPLEVLRRNVWIHIFREPQPVELIRLIGVDNSMFGSDFPHPEGLRDPLAFSEEITPLTVEEQQKVMGGNLARLMGVTPNK
jgi:predicted TIM-barrel fold metal-dependent hydrolase